MPLTRPRAILLFTLLAAAAVTAAAQAPAPPTSPAAPQADATAGGRLSGDLYGLGEVQRQLRQQREEIERMRAMLDEQARLIKDLSARVGRAAGATSGPGAAVVADASYAAGASATGPAQAQGPVRPQDAPTEERITRAETLAQKTGEALSKQLGSINFSGDIRVRHESFYGQQNALATAGGPAGALGNPLDTRQRLRLRARFGARGQLGKEFDWGLRLATGAFPDVNSTNQSLTDFFSRKPVTLDQAYLTYKPSALPGFQVQGGKFDPPWVRTELTLDSDVMTEGLNESYTRDFKSSALKQLAFVAWQLPFLERNSAFVLGPDGRVNADASGRGGRDLALYGAQLRARLEPSEKLALTLSAADLYYSGTQFITPVQFFGANVQFPATFTIPATETAPAQTVIAQVSIPRDLLVSGNANLGFSTASTNATNRDGRLSSGYNLVDLIARLDASHSKRWPLMFLLNFVKNTQAHAVVTAGPGGADLLRPNDEDIGYWAEFQVGKTQQRGDLLFNYTFTRIEKDAVLTPFNWSDILQQSDVRVQRFIVAYAVDPRVTLSLTGIFSTRPNGLLGPFGATPPGSLNRTQTRLQLDTILRF